MTRQPSDTPTQSPSMLNLPSPVLIVEDDTLMQQRIGKILVELGYANDMLFFADSIFQARQRVTEQKQADSMFSMALVDLGLPDGNGIEIITELSQTDKDMNILVISSWSINEVIFNALKAGATGYVLKERDDIEVSLSISSVIRGGAPIDPFVAEHILAKIVNNNTIDDNQDTSSEITAHELPALSRREKEVLKLVAEGMSNRQIAEQLFLSRHTIDSHIKHIYKKLSVSSRIRAVDAARSIGILG